MEAENLSNEELAALNALDNQTRTSPSGGGEEVDQSLLFMEVDHDLSEADDEWDEGRYAFQITELKLKKSKAKQFHYLELVLTCIFGRKRDRKMFDRVMIEGDKPTALARLVILGKATDMYNPDTKRFQGKYADLIGKCVWAMIVKRKDTYQGEERERAGVAFRGYDHFSKFALPDENDTFAEEGDVLEALDAAPVELAAEPVVEPVAEVTTEYVEEQGEYVEEQGGPFVDETETLETLPMEEVVEEPAPAPVAAPRAAAPTATPRAAAAPAATPRAAARPAQPGTKPPF
jgi:hypothetical protein